MITTHNTAAGYTLGATHIADQLSSSSDAVRNELS
jgi:hypothetical protein